MSEIFNYQKLYIAYLDCRKNKRKTTNALKFEWDFEKKLFDLQYDLELRKYKPGRSICFAITEPSSREIFAADFRDRVVHHLLVNEMEKTGEKIFISDSFACRKNKGTHATVNKLKKFIKKVSDNNKNEAFYAQLDIAGFFMAIDHEILYNIFKELVINNKNKSDRWKTDILWLAKEIIFHKPTENYTIKGKASLLNLIPPEKSLFNAPEKTGLPIGNYSSQFFTSLYLNKLDQFIKRELKCKYYVRYMDDFILLNKDEDKLKYFKDEISLFLKKNLKLKLKSSKTKIKSINRGIDFLGYFIKPDYVLVRKRVVKNIKHKLKNDKFKNPKKTVSVVNSYFGHFRKADSFNLRKYIFDKYIKQEQASKFRLSKGVHYLYLGS